MTCLRGARLSKKERSARPNPSLATHNTCPQDQRQSIPYCQSNDAALNPRKVLCNTPRSRDTNLLFFAGGRGDVWVRHEAWSAHSQSFASRLLRRVLGGASVPWPGERSMDWVISGLTGVRAPIGLSSWAAALSKEVRTVSVSWMLMRYSLF